MTQLLRILSFINRLLLILIENLIFFKFDNFLGFP